MKAAVVHAFGEAPRFEEFAEPMLAESEVMVNVLAAGLHPIVRMLADGSHYGSAHMLPLVAGVDGVGQLEDGQRVYFGLTRPPYGTMAERAAVPRSMCLPLPASLDEVTAAALFNPGLSSFLALRWRAQLKPGETVLVLGASGAAGRIAIQFARLLGAGRIIALGRNERILRTLPELGADVVISLNQSQEDLSKAIARESAQDGIHVILDYLWGSPTEAIIAGVTREGLTHTAPRVRLIEIGQMAGSTITLPASVLRSSGLEISGSGAGTAAVEQVIQAIPQFLEYAASGKLRIETTAVPLAEVEAAWRRPNLDNRRLVFVP
ncbi:MAG TPA: zinc-binding alcohol dehydrogenase family protein [Ktedonobacteraceae bacterium]|nr:zinc-binding alcohol dehydrogenase family protein [Ktedonobacteraceae bacterium]